MSATLKDSVPLEKVHTFHMNLDSPSGTFLKSMFKGIKLPPNGPICSNHWAMLETENTW